MSKDSSDTTLLLDAPLGRDWKDLFLRRPERAMDAYAFRYAGPRRGAGIAQFLTHSNRSRPSRSPSGGHAVGPDTENSTERRSMARRRATARRRPPQATNVPREPTAFSRGLVDTYFRQMGDAAWLSREEEIALAKRIEAAQRAMLTGLCRVPMLVERIASLGTEVAEGRLRLADLVELSAAEAEPGAPESARGGDAVAAELESGDPRRWPNAEAENVSATTARLQTIIALAEEIGSLSRKRLAAVARGRDLANRSRSRLRNSRPILPRRRGAAAASRSRGGAGWGIGARAARRRRAERSSRKLRIAPACRLRTSATSLPRSARRGARSRLRASTW